MSYRVIWQDAALAQLDEIWKASHDREGFRQLVCHNSACSIRAT